MTTSSLDMRYGRQGGRIVPWVAEHRVEVVDDELPGRRCCVRFSNGAELVVSERALEELGEP